MDEMAKLVWIPAILGLSGGMVYLARLVYQGLLKEVQRLRRENRRLRRLLYGDDEYATPGEPIETDSEEFDEEPVV